MGWQSDATPVSIGWQAGHPDLGQGQPSIGLPAGTQRAGAHARYDRLVVEESERDQRRFPRAFLQLKANASRQPGSPTRTTEAESLPTVASGPPDSRFPIPDSRFPIPDSRFPAPGSRLHQKKTPPIGRRFQVLLRVVLTAARIRSSASASSSPQPGLWPILRIAHPGWRRSAAPAGWSDRAELPPSSGSADRAG